MFAEKQLIQKVRETAPLILNISNFVTMDFVANGLLSLGASPVMSMAIEDMSDLIALSSAVVINLGTLNEEFINLADRTCALATSLNKPLILDPVGAGASRYRTDMSKKLIQQYNFSIIRANASEIAALADKAQKTKGVDSTLESGLILDIAKDLACQFNTVISVSGAVDYIIDKNELRSNETGSALMPKITGTGCLLTAITAAFNAVENNSFKAAYEAIRFYGLCGERAAIKAKGPGSFKEAFIDELFSFGEVL